MGRPASRRRPWRPTPLLSASAGLHALAAAGALAAPDRWPLAAAAVLANHVVLAATGMIPRSRGLGPNLSRLPEGAAGVALTFDDGPDGDVTPRVLDLLDRSGARATFFCVGRRAEAQAALVERMAAAGHRVENHTLTHPHGFAWLGPAGLRRQIRGAQEILSALTGREPRYLRPPAGIRSPWLEPVLARQGLHLASWTRRGYDAIDASPHRVARRLLHGLGPRDIVLLHDGSLLPRRRPPAVLEVLPRLLQALDAAGLEAVPLPEREHERL